nr:poly(3-hydroxyalkanoate) depolymerase [Flexivirga meconopsidis]
MARRTQRCDEARSAQTRQHQVRATGGGSRHLRVRPVSARTAATRRGGVEYTRVVRAVGHDIRVRVRPGFGDGPVLLLCNGIGASLEVLHPLVDRLDPSITAVRFDVPGVGGSPDARLPYTMPVLAHGLGILLDKLGYDRADVFGISWGGALAQQFAFQHPQRCRRAVLVSTGTGSIMIPAGPKVLARMVTPRRYRDPDYALQIAAELYGGSIRDNPAAVRTLVDSHTRAGSRRGYRHQLLAGAGWCSLPWLRLIRQPTLLLFGDDDPLIPVANGRILERGLPHGELVVYPGGHLDVVVQADTYGPVISEFLLR